MNELNLTPKLNRLLQLADLERQSDGASYVATEHLVIAILLDNGSAAARILKSKGIDIDDFRKFTRRQPDLSK